MKPISIGDAFTAPMSSLAASEGALPYIQSADRGIDAALKSVPLPDGFISRLGLMLSALPDELSDHMDYLGC
jgi:hypothetical protein